MQQIETLLEARAARAEDAEAIAEILAEAFPALYRSAFGLSRQEEIAWLLAELYRAGHLSLSATRVCERGGRVVGLAILHLGESIGRGSARDYGRLLLRQLGLWRGLRAFLGGLSANAFLSRRIPHASDLVYIEALAVAAAERGRGVGTRLLEDAADWALQQKRFRLALHVLYSNAGARRLYERQGFRPWEEFTRLRTAEPRSSWAALLMVRSLTPPPQRP